MNYRVVFSRGNFLTISEKDFNAILESGAEGKGLLVHQGKIKAWINLRKVDYITPEEETQSGIASSPTPDDLRDKKRKTEEAIKADPKRILERAQKKYDTE